MRALSIVLDGAREDEAAALLWERGTAGIEVRPLASSPLVELIAYFEEPPDAAELSAALPGARVSTAAIPEVDWVARFREGFRSFRVGRFVLAPAWDPGPPDADRIVIDPGRAFGTGTHETTKLCLGALEQLAASRPLGRTLDLGSGTGLLAVAAERLGARAVVAADLDPEAVGSSRLHAQRNGARVHVVRADGGTAFRAGSFDLVLANLMALFLIDRAAEVRGLVADGGALVMSGLLLEDAAAVRDAYAPACGEPRQLELGEWAALVFERVPPRGGQACP
jgi:ribosomal protein L11 methyltransferase